LLKIEFIEKKEKPQELAAILHDDWISSLQLASHHILTGSFDGSCRIYSKSGSLLTTLQSDSPIKCVDFLSPERPICSSLDGSLKSFDLDGNVVYNCKGHLESVEALAVSKTHFASGSYDKSIRIWSCDPKAHISVTSTPSTTTTTNGKRNKSKKPRTEPEIVKTSVNCLEDAHTASITGLVFNSSTLSTLYSSSLDQTIKIWDLTSNSSSNHLVSTHK
jgi:hypothetical protein